MIEDVVQSLIECLIWRKSAQVNDLSGKDFPDQLYSSGVTTLGTDGLGVTCVYIRVKLHKKVDPAWSPLIVSFVNYVFEKLDKDMKGRPIGLVIDLSGAGLANFDMENNVQLITLFSKYYPMSCRYLWLYEASWLVRPALMVMLRMIPTKYQKLVKLMDKKQAFELMGIEGLPDFMGGMTKTSMWPVPEDAPSLETVAERLKISESGLKKMRDYLARIEK